MNKILGSIFLILLLASCKEDYAFSTKFSTPTELNSPVAVSIDVTSTENVLLSWSGGGAEVGNVVYEVLFDKPGGDFTHPVYRCLSDLGAEAHLTLSHALLNTIARKAGVNPSSTGSVSWTVTASKGGEVAQANLSKQIAVTRGGGIDYTGNSLYIYGTSTENAGVGGLEMRKAADGIFVIYTRVPTGGSLYFKSSKTEEEAFECFADENFQIKEGKGAYAVKANATDEFYRMTVDLNTQSFSIDAISKVRAIWGATYDVIGNLVYTGNGVLKADDCAVRFIMPSRPETNPPTWCTWTEERYYFVAKVNGVDKCWGRKDGVSPERPVGTETADFYEISETAWSQWEHLWKMKGSLDMKKCSLTIDTNKNGLMVHEFSNIQSL